MAFSCVVEKSAGNWHPRACVGVRGRRIKHQSLDGDFRITHQGGESVAVKLMDESEPPSKPPER